MAEPISDVLWGLSLRDQHRHVRVPQVVGRARSTDRRLHRGVAAAGSETVVVEWATLRHGEDQIR